MKIEHINKAPSGFQPVTLTITLETPEELHSVQELAGAPLAAVAAAWAVGEFYEHSSTDAAVAFLKALNKKLAKVGG